MKGNEAIEGTAQWESSWVVGIKEGGEEGQDESWAIEQYWNDRMMKHENDD